MLFHQSNEKTWYCYTFYNENRTMYLYKTCNTNILFVKNTLAYCGYSPILHSSCCFLNTNTVIRRQLIQTARTLEAEWWQVCGEVWVRGQRKMSQVLDAFGLLDFNTLRPILTWCAFWNLWTIYFSNFPNFFLGWGELWTLNPQIRGSACICGVFKWHDFYASFRHVRHMTKEGGK